MPDGPPIETVVEALVAFGSVMMPFSAEEPAVDRAEARPVKPIGLPAPQPVRPGPKPEAAGEPGNCETP